MSDERNDDKRKVVDLAEKRKSRQKTQTPDDPSPEGKTAARCHFWFEVLEGRASAAPWPHKLAVWEPEPGHRQLVRVLPDESCEIRPLSWLVSEILKYSHKYLRGTSEALANSAALEVAEDYLKRVPDPLEIKPVRWQGELGPCWQRLPWELRTDPTQTLTPTWNGLLRRCSNATALVSWLGALFYPEARHQSYLWVHGAGADGKGALARFLVRVWGRAAASKNPPQGSRETTWAYGLLGKRLVIFPDLNDRKFVTSGYFKALTGKDAVEVERKFHDSFTAKIDAMYMILSNNLPVLSDQRSDQRRIILCEITGQGTNDPKFEDKLWEEGGYFLSHCIETYLLSCPQHGEIPRDETQALLLGAQKDSANEALLESLFTISYDPADQKFWVAGETVLLALRGAPYYLNFIDIGRWLDWLQERHGVKRVSIRENGKVVKRHKFLIKKPFVST